MRSGAPVPRRPVTVTAALAVPLFVAHVAIFGAMFKTQGLVTDLELHARIVRVGIEEQTLPGNFLFYLTAAIGAGLSTSDVAIKAAMTVVLAGTVSLKYVVSAAIAAWEAPARPPPTALLVAVALLSFAFSLPTSEVYLGQLPPNVWHNSTTIFLMPFALTLFWCSFQYLRDGQRAWLWATVAAGAVNVAAKPSLLFALLPVFPFFALARFGATRKGLEALAATAAMGCFVLLQYLYTFKTGSTEAVYEAGNFGVSGESSVSVDLFHVWSYYSSAIPLSVLASFAFPVLAFAVFPRLLDDWLVRYAVALAATAVVVFAVFTESGVREFHGNFIWQAMVANYILFLVILVRVWPLLDFSGARLRSAVVSVGYAAHVVAGFAFLGYYFANRTYF